jgi:hypothetical protein
MEGKRVRVRMHRFGFGGTREGVLEMVVPPDLSLLVGHRRGVVYVLLDNDTFSFRVLQMDSASSRVSLFPIDLR